MERKRENGTLHIVFHNPNSAEDTVKYLSKIIAESLAQQAINGLLHTDSNVKDEAQSPLFEDRQMAV